MAWSDKVIEHTAYGRPIESETEKLRRALHFWMKRIDVADLDDYELKLFRADAKLVDFKVLP